MLSPYRIPPKSYKRREKISDDNSKSEHDLERPQKIEVVKPDSDADSTVNRTRNKKSKLKGGAKTEIIDNHLDEILHYKNL